MPAPSTTRSQKRSYSALRASGAAAAASASARAAIAAPLRRARALGAAPGGVGADAGAQLERRALELELRRRLALGGEREQQVEPAVVAPVAHPRRAAVADPDQARFLQPLERLANGVPAGPELLGQPPLGRHGGTRRERAGEDVGAQAGVDAIGQEHW